MQGQSFLTVTSNHAESGKVQDMLRNPPHFLGQVKVAAEQLSIAARVKVIGMHAFRKLIDALEAILVNRFKGCLKLVNHDPRLPSFG